MTIRQLTVADAEAYRTLRLQALHDAATAFGSSYEEEVTQTVTDIAQRFQDSLSSTNVIFGAFADQRLIGLVGLRRDKAKKRLHKMHLWGMFVEPHYQRAGIGRRLLEQVIACAQAIPAATCIELSVEATNLAAIRLYESCGFKTWGTEPQALCVGSRYYDEHFMTKQL